MKTKRGMVLVEYVVLLAIIGVGFLLILSLFSRAASPKLSLTFKEAACRETINLHQIPALGALIPVTGCTTRIVPFTEKTISKQAKKGESTKDAAGRQILESMQRCKDMIAGPKSTTYLSGKSCYVCYSLQTDATTPYLTSQELTSYSLTYREPHGQTYFASLREGGHVVLPYLPTGFGAKRTASTVPPSGPQPVAVSKHYGVVYTVFEKGSLTKIVAAGAGACVLSLGVWLVPFVGPAAGAYITPLVCSVSLSAAGGFSLFELFQSKDEGVGGILVTDYKSLEEYGCDTLIS